MTEFELIRQLAEGLDDRRDDTLVGIGDDAAIVRPGEGDLVTAVDSMVEGVHFFPDCDPADLGWKALAVNLSDLAAMGAQPRWALLALTLPQVDQQWLRRFVTGWRELAQTVGLQLIGGDTCRGPRAVSVTVIGSVLSGRLLRSGARIGDDLYVSGYLGDAAAGLALLEQRLAQRAREAERCHLISRLHRPQPRTATGLFLADHASAAIDVSDGLLADLGHLLRASGAAATIDLDALPVSDPLKTVVPDDATRERLILNGGDDYELLFCAAPNQRAVIASHAEISSVPLTRIGRVHAGEPGLVRAEGRSQPLLAQGWDHFGEC